jgi:ribose-phosphate pyrophosphokinase
MQMLVVGCSNAVDIARNVARRIGAPFLALEERRFPDGELYLRYTTNPKGKRVVIVQSMHPAPNETFMEALWAAHSARQLGAKEVWLVATYLAYMRQDKAFHPGEAVSARIMAKLIDGAFDRIYAMDPHLHRIHNLQDIFRCKAIRLTANDALAAYIDKTHPDALIIGPDWESYQWAQVIAEKINHHAVMLKKKRYTSRKVRIKVKADVSFRGKDVVIIDDIISTGRTMIEPIKQLKRMGCRRITCMTIHGVFAEGALQKLQRMGAKVVATNSMPSPVSRIDLSRTIAAALKKA